jgi:putative membrane protein
VEPAPSTTDLAFQRTDLALDRTVMAAERTLMAWGRTGLSQIGLGLSLFKFLQAMKVRTGYDLALLVVVIGVVATLVGIYDYKRTIQRLSVEYDRTLAPVQYHVVLASMIALFGLLVLVALVVRSDVW